MNESPRFVLRQSDSTGCYGIGTVTTTGCLVINQPPQDPPMSAVLLPEEESTCPHCGGVPVKNADGTDWRLQAVHHDDPKGDRPGRPNGIVVHIKACGTCGKLFTTRFDLDREDIK